MKFLIVAVLAAIMLFALLLYWSVTAWNECRDVFSFWTCVRIMFR